MGVVSLMELNKNMQILIEKVWGFKDKTRKEINNSYMGLEGFCSEYGYTGGFAEAPLKERKRLIAVRDALEVVENMLLFLQRLQSQQQIDRQVAFTRLEQSRLDLITTLTEHHGRSLDVIQEMLAFFGDENKILNWNPNYPLAHKLKPIANSGGARNGIACFLNSWFRVSLNPWKWRKAAILAVRSIVVPVSIVSMIYFHHKNKQKRISYNRMNHLYLNSMEIGNLGPLQPTPNNRLDVFHGRG